MSADLERELREQIMEALGEASVSWTEAPSGCFDSAKAVGAGEKLLNYIRFRYVTQLALGAKEKPAA